MHVNLTAATRYAALGSAWLADAPLEARANSEAFVFDYLIGRALQLLLQRDEQKLVPAIDDAVSALDQLAIINPATKFLITVLHAHRCEADSGAPVLNPVLLLRGRHKSNGHWAHVALPQHPARPTKVRGFAASRLPATLCGIPVRDGDAAGI